MPLACANDRAGSLYREGELIRVILIRHGRTAWNMGEGEGERFRGQIDLPLADEGIAQAQATARRLAAAPVAALYSSPLQRAARTAEILAQPHGLPVQPLPGLTSMNHGEWAGRLHADVARRWPDAYRQWRRDPFSIRIPGGESMADLRDRAVAAVLDALRRHVDGATLVLVCHEVICRTLACALAGMHDAGYWLIRQGLCNLTSFDYDPAAGTFVLAGLNDICHLGAALPRAAGDGVRVVLIRHGQTAWNVGAGVERFRGRTDLPLDEVGQAQARAVGARLSSEAIGALYASPLQRAQQTLAPLAQALGLPIQPSAGLLDIDYGDWQGLTHLEAAAAYPEAYALWRSAPSQVRFPGGEGLPDVQARLCGLLDELATRHPGQTVALVGHQIVNKVAVCTLLGLGLDQIGRIQQDTCGFDVFQRVDGAWHTLSVNDTCHLPALG
jgi:broad specificity phosphatase PhoE